MDGSQDSPTSDLASPLSPLTELDSPLPLLLDIPAPATTVPDMFSTLKRKRTVMDYVAVPDRRYKVRVSDKLVLTHTGPDPSTCQETVSGQLVSGGLSTASTVAEPMVYKQRDREVMQTDSLGSPTSGASLHNPTSGPHIPLIFSPPAINPKNSASFPSQKNKTTKYTSKKPRSLSSSPTPPIVSSQFQTRIVTSPSKGEKNSRLDRPSLAPMTSDQSSGLVKIAEERQRKSALVRKLPRIKKNPRTTNRVLHEGFSYQSSSSQSSSSSSAYPRSSPSDGSDLAQVFNDASNENYSTLEALNADPHNTEPSINNTVPQAAQITPTDSAALDKAVKDLTDATRTINQLQYIPAQNYDSICAAAAAMDKFLSHHSQYTTVPSPPGWFQGNHSLMPVYAPLLPRKWSAPVYQQPPSQYHNVRYYAAPPCEGQPQLKTWNI
ncbi:hypothetical protein C0995_009271 [Termitomyces sp. Mi166|nr:hypothetical protein C0995_009271 [Termitomyces sp. Mi166\